MHVGGTAPLFILSFRHRDELTGPVEALGWAPIAARRPLNIRQRFMSSRAAVAIVDARDAAELGLKAVSELGAAAEDKGAALLVLLAGEDMHLLHDFFKRGATHFLLSPFSDEELGQAIKFAERHAQRLRDGSRVFRRCDENGLQTGVSWRWRPGSRAVELSPVLARKAGIDETDGQRISLFELFRKLDPEGRRAARNAVERLMETGQSTAFAHRDHKGARLAHHVRVDWKDGEIVGRTEMISERNAPNDGRDLLTGVRDGRFAREWMNARLEEAVAKPHLLLLLISVSRFDAINAAFGRGAGDDVLQAVARRIERIIDADHKHRLVARMNGPEFAVLIPGPVNSAEARFLADQLVETISRPFVSGDHVITLGCRVGVIESQKGDDAEAMLRRAAAILATPRDGEAGPIHAYEMGNKEAPAFDDRLEVDLRRALDRDEIEILFQPQVAIASGKIVGVEALARWRHPAYGELGAATLFNVAERSDYLVQLSDHIQRKTIALAAAWPKMLRNLRLSLNITAADIVRPGFASHFLKLVGKSGFEVSRLTVEVTESGLIEDLGAAANLLAHLREGGLRIAIDDFGTGYSSLAYLKALPLDYLKLDKRLCEDITGSSRDRIVVRSVIDMARSLGLGVIAEGVETEEQLDLLAKEGCTIYQGFLCSEPVGPGVLEMMIGP